MADLSTLLEDVASWILSPLPMDLEELLTALPLLKPLVTWRGPCEELMEQERDFSWVVAPPLDAVESVGRVAMYHPVSGATLITDDK